MRIAVGADHAGFALKEKVKASLESQGHQVLDFGTHSLEPTDYPDYAVQVAGAVARGSADRGVLICTTGMGMAMTANKVPGIRAALAVNEDEVALTRAHNDANVLTLAAKYTSAEQAEKFVGLFLSTGFEGGRHERRVKKMAAVEQAATRRGE